MSIVTVKRKVLAKNDEIAALNRERLARHGGFAVNLVSSPGSGKTSIVERTLEYLTGKVRIAVIEGDVQTDLDAQRVARFDVPVVQIVTNGACHLEAKLVQDALDRLALDGVRLLIIENVGNLVCPSAAGYSNRSTRLLPLPPSTERIRSGTTTIIFWLRG